MTAPPIGVGNPASSSPTSFPSHRDHHLEDALPDTTSDLQDEDLPSNVARQAEIMRWRPLEVPAVNDNDVRGFVHGWFAAFERLLPAEFFLDRFDPDFVFGEHRTPAE